MTTDAEPRVSGDASDAASPNGGPAATTPRFKEPPAPPLVLPGTPYKGLVPFTEHDTPFFFGRDLDRALISANLVASRLTILYGPSGVGKSSVLHAGVLPDQREQMRRNIRAGGGPKVVVVAFNSWRVGDPVAALELAVREAVAELTDAELELDESEPRLSAVLTAASDAVAAPGEPGGMLLLILDQFEEYFLYHRGPDDQFAEQFADVVNDPALRVHFLLSLREDALAMLDRFQGEIPSLFDNYLRVEHLDEEGARKAIVGPKDRWNELAGERGAVEIEPELVDAVVDELQTGRVIVGIVGRGMAEPEHGSDLRIETPYLQLVMTRLWDETRAEKSATMRLATLERLGGSDEIVRTHLDKTMKVLPRYERYVAARVFHYLVTPSGTKIAHAVSDLAQYANVGEHDLKRVAVKLAGPDMRILRPVDSAEGSDEPRYEIFHDVLAAAILDWRTRFLRPQRVFEAVRRGLAVVLLCFAFGLWVSRAYDVAGEEGAKHTAAVIWVICGLAIWGRTTWLLFRRWQRRSVWIIPIIGLLAAVAGPMTLLWAAYVWLVRRWRRHVASRAEAAAEGDRRRRRFRRRTVTPVEPYVMGSAMTGMLGSGLLIVGCVLPIYKPDDGTNFSLVDQGGWDATQPLTAATAVALIGMVVFAGRLPRLLTSGLLIAFGLMNLAEFVGDIGYATQADNVSVEAGARIGLIGAALILARPIIPERVLDMFAGLIGAGPISGDEDRPPPMFTDRFVRPGRTQIVSAAAYAAATALLFCGFFLPAVDLSDAGSYAITSIARWLWLAPLTPPVGAAAVTIAVLASRPDRKFVAGLVLALGIGAVALYCGILGKFWTRSYASPDVGVYCGLAGGLILLGAGALLLWRDRAHESPADAGSLADAAPAQ